MTTPARVKLCTGINIVLILIIWSAVVLLPVLIWSIPWWAILAIAVVGLVGAGYFVQYVCSPIVTRMVCGYERQ